MIEVRLTPIEVAVAAMVGVNRQNTAIRDGRPDRHGFEGPGWNVHIEGAAGEMAVAKALGIYWPCAVNTFKMPDVGRLQVRTRSDKKYDLIVRHCDSPHEVFVLVIGRVPTFEVVGWIKGVDAQRDEWLQDYGGRPPAWFVPQKALVSIDGGSK